MDKNIIYTILFLDYCYLEKRKSVSSILLSSNKNDNKLIKPIKYKIKFIDIIIYKLFTNRIIK